MTGTRKLAAILVADIVGYSRLAGADEDRTLARLRGLRSDHIDPAIAVHHGRIVKRTGDGSIIEFRSVVDASVAVDGGWRIHHRGPGMYAHIPMRHVEIRSRFGKRIVMTGLRASQDHLRVTGFPPELRRRPSERTKFLKGPGALTARRSGPERRRRV